MMLMHGSQTVSPADPHQLVGSPITGLRVFTTEECATFGEHANAAAIAGCFANCPPLAASAAASGGGPGGGAFSPSSLSPSSSLDGLHQQQPSQQHRMRLNTSRWTHAEDEKLRQLVQQ